MNWRELFRPGKNFTPAQAREFMAARNPVDYQLLDVRKPSEYEQGHLADSILIPLADLSARLAELDPIKPTIVYCAVGARSKVAAQLLAGKGFSEIYNLSGGFKAWTE